MISDNSSSQKQNIQAFVVNLARGEVRLIEDAHEVYEPHIKMGE